MLLIVAISLLSTQSFAQKKTTETFNVSGNCGMCKKTIEKAASDAGADFAEWNKETKQMTVKFRSGKTSLETIQDKIANAGYDNAGKKASDAAYGKLPQCCQYDRKAKTAAAHKHE